MTDEADTVDALVQSSDLPISVVVAGLKAPVRVAYGKEKYFCLLVKKHCITMYVLLYTSMARGTRQRNAMIPLEAHGLSA